MAINFLDNVCVNTTLSANAICSSYYYGNGSFLTNLNSPPISAVYVSDLGLGSIKPLSGSNTNSGYYSTIGGGISNRICSAAVRSFIGSGYSNVVSLSSDWKGTPISNTWSNCGDSNILGGYNNTICQGPYFYNNLYIRPSHINSSVLGGAANKISVSNVLISSSTTLDIANNTITGGKQNCIIDNSGSVIGGGGNNCITGCGTYSNISGGYNNTINNTTVSQSITIAGGRSNTAAGDASFIAGGCSNTVSHACSFIIGQGLTSSQPNFTYVNNLSSQGAVCTTSLWINGNQINSNSPYIASPTGAYSITTAAVAANNTASGLYSNINGGYRNFIDNANCSSIISGSNNYTNLNNTFILGSGLSAAQANFTYVNNLSTPGNIVASGNITANGNVYGGVGVTFISGNTYTLQLSDNGNMIGSLNTTGLSASYSPSINYPIGFQTGFTQLNTGRIFLSSGNAPVNQAYGYYKTTQIYSTATVMYMGPSVGWVLFGDLAN